MKVSIKNLTRNTIRYLLLCLLFSCSEPTNQTGSQHDATNPNSSNENTGANAPTQPTLPKAVDKGVSKPIDTQKQKTSEDTQQEPIKQSNQPKSTDEFEPKSVDTKKPNEPNQTINIAQKMNKDEVIYTININTSGTIHGETAKYFDHICYDKPLILVFNKSELKATLSCSTDATDSISFSYTTSPVGKGLKLLLNGITVSKPKFQNIDVNGVDYSTENIFKNTYWFFNDEDNSIESVFTHNPEQFKGVNVQFKKRTITCGNGADTQEIAIEKAMLCFKHGKPGQQLGFLKFSLVTK